jgi:membrane protease YdiL (CAAX protease family)
MTRPHPATNATRFTVGVAVFAWLFAWLAGVSLSGFAVFVAGYGGESRRDIPTSVTVLGIFCLWIPFVVALAVVSQRWGQGRFGRDFKVHLRWVDVAGLPIGIASQLLLVNLVYWPLERIWPETFSAEKIEQPARELWDRAHGGWVVVLVLVVALGAPIIEELVYRGLVLQSLQSRLNDWVALVIGSAWFALIHLQPVQFFGLFAFALVLGICFQRTGRLGMSVMAHIGFNAAGLLLASR